jgi:hypothetical protein
VTYEVIDLSKNPYGLPFYPWREEVLSATLLFRLRITPILDENH